ncbi:hypothetical protein NMY22_g5375 [Coprinellus aureogranulatus]|nr:hypothetical protein NMY22_g5375 [Coprinellus aureogranulatus]
MHNNYATQMKRDGQNHLSSYVCAQWKLALGTIVSRQDWQGFSVDTILDAKRGWLLPSHHWLGHGLEKVSWLQLCHDNLPCPHKPSRAGYQQCGGHGLLSQSGSRDPVKVNASATVSVDNETTLTYASNAPAFAQERSPAVSETHIRNPTCLLSLDAHHLHPNVGMDDSYAPMDPNAPPNNPLSMPLPVEMLGMTNWLLPPDRPEGAPAEPNHQATTVGRAPGDMFGATGSAQWTPSFILFRSSSIFRSPSIFRPSLLFLRYFIVF